MKKKRVEVGQIGIGMRKNVEKSETVEKDGRAREGRIFNGKSEKRQPK